MRKPVHRNSPSDRAHRVVIVEPHDDSREMYATYLDWVGIQVTAVPVAADALRILSDEPADAVILCLNLPMMDGFALGTSLRMMPGTRAVPLIALSTTQTEHERALRDGKFSTVLMKPCLPEVLLRRLRMTLAAGPAGPVSMELSRPAASASPD